MSVRQIIEKTNSVVGKQYQQLDYTYGFDKITKKEPTLGKYSKSDVIYDPNHSFYRYYHDKEKCNKLK